MDADRTSASESPDDPARVESLRAAAAGLRERGGERASLLAAVLSRVSDLHDPAESSDPDPEDIYSDVRTVLRVTERGRLARDPDRRADTSTETRGSSASFCLAGPVCRRGRQTGGPREPLRDGRGLRAVSGAV